MPVVQYNIQKKCSESLNIDQYINNVEIENYGEHKMWNDLDRDFKGTWIICYFLKICLSIR